MQFGTMLPHVTSWQACRTYELHLPCIKCMTADIAIGMVRGALLVTSEGLMVRFHKQLGSLI